VGGLDLERVLFVDADFKERDGAPGVVDVDLFGDGKSPDRPTRSVRSPHSAAEHSRLISAA
jgi:hypothetical protein